LLIERLVSFELLTRATDSLEILRLVCCEVSGNEQVELFRVLVRDWIVGADVYFRFPAMDEEGVAFSLLPLLVYGPPQLHRPVVAAFPVNETGCGVCQAVINLGVTTHMSMLKPTSLIPSKAASAAASRGLLCATT